MDMIIKLKIFTFIYFFTPRKKSKTFEAEGAGIERDGSCQAII